MVEIHATMKEMQKEIDELKNYVKALTQRIDTMEIEKETRQSMNTILDFVEKHNK
jgi:uncharacterized membrane protein (DUF106 family)